MKEHKINPLKKYPYSVTLVCMLLLLVLTLCISYSKDCQTVREGVLRLHVIANSDSEEDQEIKLKVRDAMLTDSAPLFDGSVTAEGAAEEILPYLEALQESADKVLSENGVTYRADAKVVYEYFNTRSYGDITLPAGYYTALKVVLGEGEGKNWWCVMFPPLCLPAAEENTDDNIFQVFKNDGEKVVEAANGYCIRFKIVELAEKVAQWIKTKI